VTTEREVLNYLRGRYSGLTQGARRYVIAEHVPQGQVHRGNVRIADFIAQDTQKTNTNLDGSKPTYHYPGGYSGVYRFLRHGHEVKVSRSDWLTELKDPSKAEAWKRYCDRWWLVAPKGVVRDDLPEDWGLITTTKTGLRVAVQAPVLDPEPLPPISQIMLMRAVQATALRVLQ